MTFEEKMGYYKDTVDKRLKAYMEFEPKKQERLFDAMRYSLMAGGKRIRAILTLEFSGLCGGDIESALPAACAIEMIHTFSLIHDDLPCMDNDDMRRGKKSCHKAFDEATALLAGDSLEIYPFEIITESTKYNVSPENTLKMIRLLAQCAGHLGMIGGQQIDTQFEGEDIGLDALMEMYRLKTSRLLQAAACIGCISAGADDDTVKMAYDFGEKIGLAFQIVDDILDVCADPKELGKPVGSDEKSNKKTYVSILGIDNARDMAKTLTNEAMLLLDNFSDNEFLKQLTAELLIRNK